MVDKLTSRDSTAFLQMTLIALRYVYRNTLTFDASLEAYKPNLINHRQRNDSKRLFIRLIYIGFACINGKKLSHHTLTRLDPYITIRYGIDELPKRYPSQFGRCYVLDGMVLWYVYRDVSIKYTR